MDTDKIPDFKPENLRQHALGHLKHKGKNRHPVEVAFYGGTFLGMPKDRVFPFLRAATDLVNEGVADQIRFSTRPDTITEKRLELISGFPVSTVELGVQSMDDRVLATCVRGHSASDTVKAVSLLKGRGYRVGVQLMVGLPGDTEAGSFSSVEKVAALAPDCVRIYPAVVLKGSELSRWYARGDYTPWPLDACVGHVKRLYLYFLQHKIRVIRMGLQPSETLRPESHLVAGPFHPAFGHLVQSEMFYDVLVSFLQEKGTVSDPLIIRVHPFTASKTAGYANRNIASLKARFHIHSVLIRQDPFCPRDFLFVEGKAIQAPC